MPTYATTTSTTTAACVGVSAIAATALYAAYNSKANWEKDEKKRLKKLYVELTDEEGNLWKGADEVRKFLMKEGGNGKAPPAKNANEDENQEPKAIVFIHGWPDNTALWYGTIDALRKRNGTRYRYINISLPNFEPRPDQEKPSTGYTFDQTVEMIKDTMKDTNVYNRPTTCLVAHDWGCLCSYRLLEKYPDAVGRFVSLDIGAPNLSLPFLMFVLGYQSPLNLAYLLGPAFGGDSLTRTVASVLSWPRYEHATTPSATGVWPYRRVWYELLCGDNRTLQAAKNWRPDPQVPFCFIYGGDKPPQAQFMSKEWIAGVTSRNEQSRIVEMKGCRHWLMLDDPETFYTILQQFLEDTVNVNGVSSL